MTSPVYPESKASGVEWLGDVPSHWRITPLKQIAAVVNGYPFDSKAFNGERGYPLIRIRDLGADVAETYYDGEFVEAAAITCNDVLIGMDGDFNVGRWLGAERALLNQRVCCIRGHSELVTRLLEYALPIPLKAINDITYSTTVKHLSSYQVEKIRVALPPGDQELATITAFLDRETAKIDALVKEQKRLIELLREKRQAVIFHAVTKGLNPDTPMKESGIEYLGKVPQHWEVVPLMRLTEPGRNIMYGIVLPGPNVEDGVPIVKGGDVRPHRLRLELLNRTTYEIESPFARARLKPNDIVYSIRGTIGDAELVPEELLDANITQDVARVSPSAGVHSAWLLWALKSRAVFSQLDRLSAGAAVRGINIFDLKRARVPVPPKEEQKLIAAQLSRNIGELDALVQEANASIALLGERRSALISACVTGKIDVRGLAEVAEAAE